MLPERTLSLQPPKGAPSAPFTGLMQAKDGTLVQLSHVTAFFVGENEAGQYTVVAQTAAGGFQEEGMANAGAFSLTDSMTETQADDLMAEIAGVFGSYTIEYDSAPAAGEEDPTS